MKNFLVCSFVLFEFVISQNIIKNYRFQVSPLAKQKKIGWQNFVLLWLRQNELPNPKPKHFFFATRSVANPCKFSPFSLARRRGDRTAGA
jgi:hypothetical protein